MAKDDIADLVVRIAREIGINPDEVDDLQTFLNRIYEYIVSTKNLPKTEKELSELLELARESKMLNEPLVNYLILKRLEESKYKEGFEHGLMISKTDEKKRVEEKYIEILEKFLTMFEKFFIPNMMNMMKAFQPFSRGTTTNTPPIVFEDEELKNKEGVKIEFEEEEKER